MQQQVVLCARVCAVKGKSMSYPAVKACGSAKSRKCAKGGKLVLSLFVNGYTSAMAMSSTTPTMQARLFTPRHATQTQTYQFQPPYRQRPGDEREREERGGRNGIRIPVENRDKA